jgi:hypothetical protein
MTVHFYDVGQALAVLVDLPDGRHVLVDAGDNPHRAECDDCATKHEHLIAKLRSDLAGAPIDLMWITHQHSDHIGGAPDVLGMFKVGTYVDNGRDPGKAEVRRAHEAADKRDTSRRVSAMVPFDMRLSTVALMARGPWWVRTRTRGASRRQWDGDPCARPRAARPRGCRLLVGAAYGDARAIASCELVKVPSLFLSPMARGNCRRRGGRARRHVLEEREFESEGRADDERSRASVREWPCQRRK